MFKTSNQQKRNNGQKNPIQLMAPENEAFRPSYHIWSMHFYIASSISFSGWNADNAIKVLCVKRATHISILLIIQVIYVKITRIYSRNASIAIVDILYCVIKLRQRGELGGL